MAAVMAEYATVAEAIAQSSPSHSQHVASKQYKVRNVDDKGRIIHVGYLEVSELGLTFTFEHYPDEATHWPFKCIRKYGVNGVDGVFAMEVGRRSVTGEGRYAFRTVDAEEICTTVDHFTSHSWH